MPKPDAAARKAELARNPGSASVVVNSDDDAFLNRSLGIEPEDGSVDPETGEYKETEPETEVSESLSADEIAGVEKEIGRKLTEDEIAELTNAKKEAEEGKETEVPEDFTLIKPENLPKELQPHFKRMLGSFTRGMQGISEVKRKAELFDYFTENPQMVQKMLSGETGAAPRKGEAAEVDTEEAANSFIEQLNLPEENELTPAFKALAKIMVKGFGEVKAGKDADAQTEIKKGVKAYFDANPKLVEDKELCVTMDRIGMESPRLYLNMPRLRKFAEAELGRPAKEAKEQARLDLAKLYKNMKEARKSAIPKPSVTSDKGATGKTKDIAEAFERALTQVRRKYTKK